jgi:hypothetical protein
MKASAIFFVVVVLLTWVDVAQSEQRGQLLINGTKTRGSLGGSITTTPPTLPPPKPPTNTPQGNGSTSGPGVSAQSLGGVSNFSSAGPGDTGVPVDQPGQTGTGNSGSNGTAGTEPNDNSVPSTTSAEGQLTAQNNRPPSRAAERKQARTWRLATVSCAAITDTGKQSPLSGKASNPKCK